GSGRTGSGRPTRRGCSKRGPRPRHWQSGSAWTCRRSPNGLNHREGSDVAIASKKGGKKRRTVRKRRGRGEGSVFERGDGVWVGSINLGLTPEGRRKRKTVYGSTKQDVLDELDELRGNIKSGTLPDAGKLTVGQFLTRWLESSREGLALATF